MTVAIIAFLVGAMIGDVLAVVVIRKRVRQIIIEKDRFAASYEERSDQICQMRAELYEARLMATHWKRYVTNKYGWHIPDRECDRKGPAIESPRVGEQDAAAHEEQR